MKELDDLLSVWEHHKEKGESISAEELCRENPELLDEVRRHIRALEEVASRFGIEESQFRNATLGSRSHNDQLLNREFQITNRYQIVQHHASGGLGDVFLATDPVINRKVAIKFPRQSRLTKEHLARFEREARITGQLDHPGIVAVHSLKLADDTQPCYVMRFVQGPTLHERVKAFHENTAETHERGRFATVAFRELLQHFVALCNIVGYAHDRGVIHRDIKPSNVILGPYGETFLMDWGLARELGGLHSRSNTATPAIRDATAPADDPVLRPDAVDTVGQLDTDRAAGSQPELAASPEAQFTQNGQFLGTPAFAAPEQLLGQIAQTDRRTDLYALGATLFFLITGQPAVRDAGSPAHMQSLNSGQLSWTPYPNATPAALRAICHHAMAFVPADRYPSALALAADVQQFLADEPVSVLAEPWSSRGFRWLRRNRTLTFTVATGLVLLSLLSVFATLWVSRLNSRLMTLNSELGQTNAELTASRNREEHARELAEANFDAAREAVQQYLISIDDNEKLDQTDFSDLKRELLTSAKPFLERLRDQESSNPGVEISRIEAAYRLALIEHETGNFSRAKAEYEQCIAMVQDARKQDPDNLELIYRLGKCYVGLASGLRRQGEMDRAEQLSRDAVELADKALLQYPDEVRLLDILNGSRIELGSTLSMKGDQPTAAEVLEQAIASGTIHLKLEPDSKKSLENLASAHEQLGFVLRQTGKRSESLEHRQLAMGFREQLVQRFPNRARFRTYLGMSHLNLGVMLAETGKPDLARDHYLKGLEIQQRLASDFPNNPLHLEHAAKSLNNLGNVAPVNGPGPTPDDYYQQAIEIHQQLCDRFKGDNTQAVGLGGAYCNLANFQMKFDPALAIETFAKAEDILKRFEEKSPDIPSMRSNLRNVYGGRASAFGMLYRPVEAQRDWLSASEYDEGPNRAFFQQQATEAEGKTQKVTQFEAALETGLESSDPEELAAFGEFCQARKQNHLAVKSFRQAFAEEPDLIAKFGDNGALAALAIVCESDSEPQSETDDQKRRELRAEALTWLTTQLDQLPSGSARKQKLRQWLLHPQLTSLKKQEINPDFDSAESSAWRSFWQRVEEGLK
jgi:eukaryotic-like serine/threonine-protein kinase